MRAIRLIPNMLENLGKLRRIDVQRRALAAFIFVLVFDPGSQARALGSAWECSKKWVLTWSDEFNGPDGAPPDDTKWVMKSGGNGWGNNELQYYTSQPQNIRQEKGQLVIEAIKENFTGLDGVERRYTSGRLSTAGRFSQRYGRFEARIKLPSGQGIWPAFWLLGDDISTKGWPNCGEIDIIESVGSTPSKVSGSLHGPGYFADKSITGSYTLSKGRFSEEFHVFSVEWEPQAIRFYVNDHLYAARTPADLPPGKPWVYDHAFYLILNLAVGGNLPGSPSDSTIFPQRMLVDYVRVYSRS